jgi:hypothetical protein
MSITHPRHDSRHLDDNPVSGQRRYSLIESVDSAFKLLRRHGMEKILVALRHLFRHIAQVLAPLFGLAFINDRARLFITLREGKIAGKRKAE